MRRETVGVTESLLQAAKEKPVAWSERIALVCVKFLWGQKNK